nr:MAG TPA: hypothetical protein [Caudoviricetes sp.]
MVQRVIVFGTNYWFQEGKILLKSFTFLLNLFTEGYSSWYKGL